MPEYSFTQDWFSPNIPVWERVFNEFNPSSILEIGSYEGRSTVWMAETIHRAAGGRIDCIDTWEDQEIAERFEDNTKIAKWKFPNVYIRPYVGKSSDVIPLKRCSEKYDMIYIDGSHKASDVLSDAVDSFHLCKHGGVIIFDDYYANLGGNPLDYPKLAIDFFVNCFARELEVVDVQCFSSQFFVRKR